MAGGHNLAKTDEEEEEQEEEEEEDDDDGTSGSKSKGGILHSTGSWTQGLASTHTIAALLFLGIAPCLLLPF